MLTRLVKMTFDPARVETFVQLFNENKSAIAGFNGCRHLELLRDVHDPNVFFTLSKWDSLEDLEAYRKSELFNSVWTRTKELFYAKAEAWTVENF